MPTHEHALIDGSPEKVRAKNNPLLIAYEKMVPYLIGNFGQLSHNNHLRHDVGWMDSAAKYFTKPAAAFSDTVNYWTYAPNIAKQKRDTLLAAILTLRKSVKGTQLLEANGSPNEGLWENFTRAFDTQLKPVAALKPTGSQQPQAITMLYTSTIEALREAQADLKEKAGIKATDNWHLKKDIEKLREISVETIHNNGDWTIFSLIAQAKKKKDFLEIQLPEEIRQALILNDYYTTLDLMIIKN